MILRNDILKPVISLLLKKNNLFATAKTFYWPIISEQQANISIYKVTECKHKNPKY